jgi:hypothetical protein
MTFVNKALSGDATRVLDALRKMCRGERVRVSTTLSRLGAALDLEHIALNEALRDLHRAGLVGYQADMRGLPVSGFMTVTALQRPPESHELSWLDALERAGIASEGREALQALAVKLSDLSHEDMLYLAKQLRVLSERDASHFEDAGPNVSARNLMGSAKVLAQLSTRTMSALGLPPRLQQASPRYVVCAGPRQPRATLLIENPRAFENAVRSGLGESVALICTYGFGLSYLTEDLVESLTQPGVERPVALSRSGNPPPLEVLLKAANVFLWADLDRAAFAIYVSLRGAIPQLRWSGIYAAMGGMLDEAATSHPYANLFDKAGQLLRPSAPPEHAAMRRLWERCEARAVDQEAVTDADIVRWGGTGIEELSEPS